MRERVEGQIHVTGNTIIDTCVTSLKNLPQTPEAPVAFDEFAVVTAHSREIVDNPETLSEWVRTVLRLPLPAVFPCHPRTFRRLSEFRYVGRLRGSSSVMMIPPVGYLQFLSLMQGADFIFSDPDSVVEESTAPGLGKIVFSPRTRTELPEALESGHLTLVGTDCEQALRRIRQRLEKGSEAHGHPYGTGRAGEQIASILKERLSGP
ncbi:MAG: UDP-N-acetylglucosamine 2-epimerase [Thermoplasmata archaeon]